MNKKILTIIFGIILLSSGVFAINNLDNLQGIDLPSEIIGGNSFQANFSFDYLENNINSDNSPLIIKLNVSSEDEINYPVKKNEFKINGKIEKCTWTILGTCVFPKEVKFECHEDAPIIINHSIDYTIINHINDGIFYCFNEDADLNLNENEKIILNITTHYALWPGKYNLTAQLFYLNDTTKPQVIILDKSYFNQYFRDGSYVDFETNLFDGSGIFNYKSWIETNFENFSFSKELINNNIYHFFQTLPIDIQEGEYPIYIFAEDEFGNIGNDSTTLKIDRTGPEIKLIQPNETIYNEILPIEVNVTDIKSGVDNGSIQVRLREIKDGQICPEIGGSIGNYSCITTNWTRLDYNEISETFIKGIDTVELNLTSGEYWLDAKAKDILDNEAMWIPEE